MTIVALSDLSEPLIASLPYCLSNDLTVLDVRRINAEVGRTNPLIEGMEDWRLWKQVEFGLAYEYDTVEDHGQRLLDSFTAQDLLADLASHLHLIKPTRTNARRIQQLLNRGFGWEVGQGIVGQREWVNPRVNRVKTLLTIDDLDVLRDWVSAVREFRTSDIYDPLRISFGLVQRALDEGGSLGFLLRMIAIEALFADERRSGSRALAACLDFVGGSTNVYAAFDEPSLPRIPLDAILQDLVILRNKIAHGQKPPEKFLRESRFSPGVFTGWRTPFLYVHELERAALGLTMLIWQRILRERLQVVFSDRTRLRQFIASACKHSRGRAKPAG